ncbi:hypothetical protein ABGB07_11730 [Micromonosporaceae bacterium B7E4]
MRTILRAVLVLPVAAMLLVATTVPAQAAVISVDVHNGAGKVYFNQDPTSDPQNPVQIPGDAIRACDNKADGWGIIAELRWTDTDGRDRAVSTAGHDSPYCTGWKGGDLTEGRDVWLRGCMVKGDAVSNCTGWKKSEA